VEPSTKANVWHGWSKHMITQHYLGIWGDYDQFLSNLACALYELDLSEQELPEPVVNGLYTVIETYVSGERLRLLKEHYVRDFGGEENVTPAALEAMQIPVAEIRMMNAVTQFYGLPRVFIFLYQHALVLHYLDGFRRTDYAWLAQSSLSLLMSLYEGVETAPDTQ
jgi:hypothetical protein